MKKISLSLLVLFLLAFSAQAQQNFMGKIRYSVKLTGEGADQMSAFMPTSYNYYIGDKMLKFTMDGGLTAAMMGEMVVHAETEKAYMVKHAEQVAYEITSDEDAKDEEGPKPTVTKMDEVIDIEGYKCQKYKLETEMEGETATQYMWVTDKIRLDNMGGKNMKSGGELFVEGIEGFPLKIESETMGMTMTMTAVEVLEKAYDDQEFEIPDNYEIKPFNPQMMMGR